MHNLRGWTKRFRPVKASVQKRLQKNGAHNTKGHADATRGGKRIEKAIKLAPPRDLLDYIITIVAQQATA